MKYMFASDIHGSAYFCRKTLEAYKKSGAARLILLGDILYHGPRNEFPKEYEPKQVLSMLNEYRNEIYAVRGNCDSEVDQMVLEFPMMADYALLVLNGRTFYATHGHIYNKEVLPPMQPGAVSLPKGGSPNSYGILDEHVFTIYDFEGSKVKEIAL